MELIYFILCAYGLTYILVYGSIFNPIRPIKGKLGELFHCPLCTGFWAGVFLWSINCFTELFTYGVSVTNALLLGCLSSGTSYALCSLISDGGFQYENRDIRSVDTEVDAQTRNQLLQG